MQYGKWTVLREHPQPPYTKRKLWCRCDCGLEKSVFVAHLVSGASRACRSCGVLKHGANRRKGVGDPLLRSTYGSYINMCSRCLRTSKHKAAKCYRDRPVKLCQRWLKGGFEVFLKDMGIKPSLAHSLDRIDNDKLLYSPSNCRWATAKQQVHNSRIPRKLTYKGVTKSIKGWATYLGVPAGRLHNRLRRGCTVEEVLTLPKGKHHAGV